MKKVQFNLAKCPQAAIQLVATLSLAVAAAGTSFAQTAAVDVRAAWARATVPGQKATGAFMTLTAKSALQLVSASSPAAGVTEIHEMKMDGGIMKMREVAGGLALPAGESVELKPGGYHVMLMDLKAPLVKETKVPVTLVFKDAKGAEQKLELQLPVATAAPGANPTAPGAAGHGGHGAHKH